MEAYEYGIRGGSSEGKLRDNYDLHLHLDAEEKEVME